MFVSGATLVFVPFAEHSFKFFAHVTSFNLHHGPERRVTLPTDVMDEETKVHRL